MPLAPRFLFAAAVVSIAALNAASAQANSALKVGNSSAQAFNFLPLAIGIEQKFYEKNGVDVTEVDLGGSAKLHQAMTAGALDMGLGAGTDIAFAVKGAPEKAVAAIAITPALFGVIVPYDSPIKKLSDLKGKRIGISTVGSLTQWLAFQIAKKEGWDPKSFTFITDGSEYTPQMAALETNAIDAQISGAALGWNLELKKKGRLLAPASEWVGAFLQNVVFASNDIIQKDPAAVHGFIKGWLEGVAYMESHKKETIAFARTKGYRRMVLWTNSCLTVARGIYAKRGFVLDKSEAYEGFGQQLQGLDLAGIGGDALAKDGLAGLVVADGQFGPRQGQFGELVAGVFGGRGADGGQQGLPGVLPLGHHVHQARLQPSPAPAAPFRPANPAAQLGGLGA